MGGIRPPCLALALIKRGNKSQVKLSDIFAVQWLSAPQGLKLALLEDNPDQTDEMCFDYLTPVERAEVQFKGSPSSRRAWLLGRLASKVAVGALWPGAEVEVTKGPLGRPLLSCDGFGERYVSISHTPGAALASAGERPVGVDLERARRSLNQRLLRFAFSPSELELIPGIGSNTGIEIDSVTVNDNLTGGYPGALSLWCAREAAAKSKGLGLLNHLSQVRVTGADWACGHLTVCWKGVGEVWEAEVILQITGPWLTALAV